MDGNLLLYFESFSFLLLFGIKVAFYWVRRSSTFLAGDLGDPISTPCDPEGADAGPLLNT